jgi:hypothetical protein
LWPPAARVGTVAATAVLAGLVFGAAMATYYRVGALRHNIPRWHAFTPDGGGVSRP